MENNHNLTIEYNASINEKLSNILHPLTSFGVSRFSYLKILSNKKRLFMSTNHSWFKKYIDLGLYNSKDHLRCYPNCNRISYFLWPSSMDCDDVFQALNANDICHGFNIYLRNTNFIECFHFATGRENAEIRHFYLENDEIFKRFIIYFKSRSVDFIEENDNLITSRVDPLENLKRRNEHLENFFSETTLNKYPLTHKNETLLISTRQAECLLHISSGKSMKEISNVMRISPRTIESYINLLKVQLGVYSKSSLRDLARENFFEILIQNRDFNSFVR